MWGDDPNPGSTESAQLIILDAPQTMNLRTVASDSYRTGEVWAITIYSPSDISQYYGQHLIFSIDPDNTFWASDTSLPLGQPNTNDIRVLG